MSSRKRRHADRQARRRRRRAKRIVVVAVSVLLGSLVLALVWVTVRGLMAREQLEGAIPTAVSLRDAVLSGNQGALSDEVHSVQSRTAQAAGLTSDPVWRALEFVPVLGGNLRSIRQSAAVADQLARTALPSFQKIALTVTPAELTPHDGALDLGVLNRVAAPLATAKSAVDIAYHQATLIDTSTSIAPVAQPVDQLIGLVTQTKDVVDGLDAAVTLLPGMLGADGPRRYLLLSLNSAELRSSGGIPGAISVITASQGSLAVGDSASAAGLGRFDPPAVVQSSTELALYQGLTGTWMQDVNMTPDFARAASTARAMWQERGGTAVDGVVAVDPIALGYVLAATGPIDVGSGIQLSSANASQVLLSDAYRLFPSPAAQDAFFAQVTRRVFAAITSGSANPTLLLNALERSITENRIHVWSPSADEQRVIGSFPLAGALPTSSSSVAGFGIYLNDRTESKMDSYLTAKASVGSAMCGADGSPVYGVSVSLRSTITSTAAAALPSLVVGAGVADHPRGVIATNVFVYAPSGSEAVSVRQDGAEVGFTAARDDGRSVVGIDVVLDPGHSSTIDVQFVAAKGAPLNVTATATPMHAPFPVETGVPVSCVLPTPAGPQVHASAVRVTEKAQKSPERGTSS